MRYILAIGLSIFAAAPAYAETPLTSIHKTTYQEEAQARAQGYLSSVKDSANLLQLKIRSQTIDALKSQGLLLTRMTFSETGAEWQSENQQIEKTIKFDYYEIFDFDGFTNSRALPSNISWSIVTSGTAHFICARPESCKLTEIKVDTVTSEKSEVNDHGSMSSAGGGKAK